MDDATIAALATATGRGAIAVIRLSGTDAFAVAGRVCAHPGDRDAAWPPPARHAALRAARDPASGRLLDRVLVTTFPGPASFTGEDVVEVSTHGGLAAPADVLAALVAAGARPALPGEFTRRALLNGRLDLAQAEAIGDLVDARTSAMRDAAVRQLDGGLSRRIAALRSEILGVEALLAYDVDFPEEDDGPVPHARVLDAARAALAAVEALLATVPAGEIARDGAVAVLAGPPNAGKSSLFNALLGEARALVTPVPGTTRDALEALVEPQAPDGRRAPWPIRLVDTAGLRDSADEIEQLGMALSQRWLARAHVVLACGETPADVDATATHAAALTSSPVVRVWTKADIHAHAIMPLEFLGGGVMMRVSAESGEGLSTLLATVADVVGARYGAPDPELPVVTRARHRRALEEGRQELATFAETWAAGALPATIAAIHLRAAAHALETVIGVVDVDDVLDRVFSSFCVGK